MKLIRAIVRPECEERVIRALEQQGVYAFTKLPVTGRGRQGGAQVGGLHVAELAKVMLLLVVDDAQVDVTMAAIAREARTGFPGDGRIFVSAVERAVRLRTGEIDDGGVVVAGGTSRVGGVS